jgi:hypothetical protein
MQALRLAMSSYTQGLNSLQPAPLRSGEELVKAFNARALKPGIVLSTSEVTQLWHPPAHLQEMPWLRSSTSLFVRGVELPVPKVVPASGVVLGCDPGRANRPVALPVATFRQQLAIIGATGSGKTTAALTIFLSALEQGLGGVLIDVKGDLALDVLGRTPPGRADDVCLVDMADEDCRRSIDPMGLARLIDRDLSADILASCFQREFRESWGVVIERLMKASVRALLEVDGTKLTDLPRFLRNPDYRQSVLAQVSDEMVLDYFKYEFEASGHARQVQSISPVLNRVGAALESKHGRRLFGGGDDVDLVDLRRRGGALVLRAPQGLVGERNANIAASVTATACLFAAMTFASEPESSRGEWLVVCDEFHGYANSSFAKAYSEGRSFGVCLVPCTQFLGGVPPDVRSAILANANTLICFRLGEEDAALIGRRFEPYLSRAHLTDLDNFVAAVRTSIDGERLPPFTVRVQPPAAPWRPDVAERIRERSRRGPPPGTATAGEKPLEKQIVPMGAKSATVNGNWPEFEEDA